MISTGSLSYNTTREQEQVLTNSQRDEILNDLFLGKESDLDSSFLYKGKGAELYAKISNDESYPYINTEISILEELKQDPKFKKILKKTNFITDVGSGDGQKAASLLGGTGRQGTYIAEDYSLQMLNIAENKVRESIPQIKLGSSQKLNNGNHLSRNVDNNMYLFLGGTICNMSDDEIVNELKNMDNNGIISGNKILLSYFTAPKDQEEIDNLIKIYNSENNKAFHENGMDMLGLSRDDFEYDTVYEKDNPEQQEGPFPGKIKGIIRAKRDTKVNLSDNKTISIKKGDEFTIHYSRRFSKEGIEKLFKKSGCNIVFNVDKAGDTVTLLQKRPRKLAQFANKYRKSLLSLLVISTLGVGTGIGAGVNNYLNSQKEKQKIEQETRDYRKDYINRRELSDITFKRLDLGSVYSSEQSGILMAEYNISSLNKKQRAENAYVVNNEIIDMYRSAFDIHLKSTGENLSAEDFMELYGGQIIDKYHIPYQKPYEHFRKYKKVIDNTLKYGNKLDISKYKVEEISTESELSYFMEKSHHYYNLKVVRVFINNGKHIDLMVAEQSPRWIRSQESVKGLENYSLKDGFECMSDLTEFLDFE